MASESRLVLHDLVARLASPAGADPGRAAQFVVPPPEPYASSSAYFPTASNNDMVSRYKITFGAAAGAN